MVRHRFLARSMVWAVLSAAGFAAAAVSLSEEPLQPLPENPPSADARKVALGRALFRDNRLSRDNSVSCLSCHSPQAAGADARKVSIGAQGTAHVFNSPTVWNSGLNFRQHWTGDMNTIEDLIDGGIKNPMVFGSSWAEVLAKLSKDAALAQQIKTLYPEGVTQAGIANAIATYVRSLQTPSRFDRYLRGDEGAINDEEKRGYARFKAYGCTACHQGVNVGGNMFQKFGALNDFFADRQKAGSPSSEIDQGRFRVTHKEQDLHVFKVPSLRNVAQTAPYFHDGSAATLEEAVDVMFRYQLGRTAPAADKALIITFLKSLSGQPKEELK
jgi:cytochrome c peroxidase